MKTPYAWLLLSLFFFTVQYSSGQTLSVNCGSYENECNSSSVAGNGFVFVSIPSGSAPYTYQWSTGATHISPYENDSLLALAAGVYTVTVTNQSGASGSCSATVPQGFPALDWLILRMSLPCAGTSTGMMVFGTMANVTPPPYTFSLYNNTLAQTFGTHITGCNFSSQICQATDTFRNLPAGQYTATLTNNYGCTGQFNIPFTELTNVYNISFTTSPTCGNNGKIISHFHWQNGIPATLDYTTAAYGQITGNTDNQLALKLYSGTALISSHAYTDSVFSNLAPGNYELRVYFLNSLGNIQCYDPYPITVNAGTSPSATITPNGNLHFCSGNGIALQANTGTGLTYQWRKNGVNISGATNSSYLANTTGNFNVIVTNSSGCSKGAVSVNVTGPPSNTVSALGPTHFCSGGSVTLKSVSGQSVTYQWRKNGANISGATAQTYVATSTGSYNCIVTNSFGCSKGGTAIAVTGPPSAVITANGPTTFCSGGSVLLSAAAGYTYQWIKNSTNIGGATLQNYSATTAGNYKVKVTDLFGCSKTTPNTNQITVTVPCREGNLTDNKNPDESIKIYPNPSSGGFTIDANKKRIHFIKVFDMKGKILLQANEIENRFHFGNALPAGIYNVQVDCENEIQAFKVVKTN